MLLLLAQMAALVAAVQTVQMLAQATLLALHRLKGTMVVLEAMRLTLVERAGAVLPQLVQTEPIPTAATVVTARLRLFLAAASPTQVAVVVEFIRREHAAQAAPAAVAMVQTAATQTPLEQPTRAAVAVLVRKHLIQMARQAALVS
jgi:hypothetical protein